MFAHQHSRQTDLQGEKKKKKLIVHFSCITQLGFEKRNQGINITSIFFISKSFLFSPHSLNHIYDPATFSHQMLFYHCWHLQILQTQTLALAAPAAKSCLIQASETEEPAGGHMNDSHSSPAL